MTAYQDLGELTWYWIGLYWIPFLICGTIAALAVWKIADLFALWQRERYVRGRLKAKANK